MISWTSISGQLEPNVEMQHSRDVTPAHDLINMMAYCDLTQTNLITNNNNVSLDLVLTNIPTELFNVSQSDAPILSIDMHHLPLLITANLELSFMEEKQFKFFRRSNYDEINADLQLIEGVERFYTILNDII